MQDLVLVRIPDNTVFAYCPALAAQTMKFRPMTLAQANALRAAPQSSVTAALPMLQRPEPMESTPQEIFYIPPPAEEEVTSPALNGNAVPTPIDKTPVEDDAPEASEAPASVDEAYKTMRKKPDLLAYAKTYFGVDLSPDLTVVEMRAEIDRYWSGR